MTPVRANAVPAEEACLVFRDGARVRALIPCGGPRFVRVGERRFRLEPGLRSRGGARNDALHAVRTAQQQTNDRSEEEATHMSDEKQSSTATVDDYRRKTALASVRFTFRMQLRDAMLLLTEKHGISLDEARAVFSETLGNAYDDAKEVRDG